MGRQIDPKIEWPRVRPLPNGTYLVDTGKRLSKRIRRVLPSRAEAESYAAELRGDQRTDGQDVLTDAQKLEYRHARALLKAVGNPVSVVQAVEHWLSFNAVSGRAPLIKDAIPMLLAEKRVKGKSPRYVDQLDWRLNGRFNELFGNRKPAEITPDEIAEFISERDDISDSTRMNIYRAVSSFFAFCKSRRWMPHSPIDEDRHKPKDPESTPTILSIHDAKKLVDACPPEMVVPVALAMFCGIRIQEICRLKFSDIAFDTRSGRYHVNLAAKITKKRRARNVPIPLNAELWISDYLKRSDESILPGKEGSVSYLFRCVYREAGVNHSQNVLRHTFASYFYETTRNAELTRYWLGHNCPDTLFTNYRQLVQRITISPLEYFKLLPKGSDFGGALQDAKLSGSVIMHPTSECLRFLKLTE